MTKLETAADLVSFIRSARGREAKPKERPVFNKPGNTAAIPLTIATLKKKNRDDALMNKDEYYISRANPIHKTAVGAVSCEDTRGGYTGAMNRSGSKGPVSPRSGAPRSPSNVSRTASRTGRSRSNRTEQRSVRRSGSMSSEYSVRSNVSRASARVSSLAQPKQPRARPIGVAPTMISKMDPKKKRGLGTGISASAIKAATAGYR
eukprot:TRINITY_DN5088_c0_g1_i1.p1 TRINITY_DN5088_c0_g1~~TRINITY_DN5088_c0_g1_i1.p1  ORF type:complete len:205 (+),score=27.07 TRINITY_DN5088_c0_g1_i1:132-746(+)